MIIHPNFSELEHGYAHDICLVKVAPMTLDNVNTGTVCLPSGDHVSANVDVEESPSSVTWIGSVDAGLVGGANCHKVCHQSMEGSTCDAAAFTDGESCYADVDTDRLCPCKDPTRGKWK